MWGSKWMKRFDDDTIRRCIRSLYFDTIHRIAYVCVYLYFFCLSLSLSPSVCVILCMCVYYVSIYLACCYGLSHWLHVTFKFFPIFAYQTFHTLFLCSSYPWKTFTFVRHCVRKWSLSPIFFHNDFGSAFACTIQCLISSHWQSGVALIGCFF